MSQAYQCPKERVGFFPAVQTFTHSHTLEVGLTIGRTISVVHSRSLDNSNARGLRLGRMAEGPSVYILTMSIWINAIRPVLPLQKIVYTMLDHTTKPSRLVPILTLASINTRTGLY